MKELSLKMTIKKVHSKIRNQNDRSDAGLEQLPLHIKQSKIFNKIAMVVANQQFGKSIEPATNSKKLPFELPRFGKTRDNLS